jgi:predicted RNA-binding protein with RPS1 domain
LTLEIRQFNELVIRDVEEYMKPFSFDQFVKDIDDVCQVAVMIAKKLSADDEAGFSLQMLQTISDIREPLEEKNAQQSNQEEI